MTTAAMPADPRATDAEGIIRRLVDDFAEDLADLLEVTAAAAFQTSSSDDPSSVTERDTLVKLLAQAVSAR